MIQKLIISFLVAIVLFALWWVASLLVSGTLLTIIAAILVLIFILWVVRTWGIA